MGILKINNVKYFNYTNKNLQNNSFCTNKRSYFKPVTKKFYRRIHLKTKYILYTTTCLRNASCLFIEARGQMAHNKGFTVP